MRYNFSSLMLCFFALALTGACGTAERATREPLVSPSDEVVDIGYENARKGDLSYSVSSVKPGKEDMVYSNMYDYLRGRVAGVEVGPDNTPSSVRIRGVNSINASTAPLVLVVGPGRHQSVRRVFGLRFERFVRLDLRCPGREWRNPDHHQAGPPSERSRVGSPQESPGRQESGEGRGKKEVGKAFFCYFCKLFLSEKDER